MSRSAYRLTKPCRQALHHHPLSEPMIHRLQRCSSTLNSVVCVLVSLLSRVLVDGCAGGVPLVMSAVLYVLCAVLVCRWSSYQRWDDEYSFTCCLPNEHQQ